MTSVGGSAFNGTGWYNSQSDGLLYLDHVLLGYKGNYPTGDLVIADGTRVIAGGVFSYGCSGLTSVTIPNSVTSIGNSAFYGCSGLTELTIPSSVTSIDEQVFFNCTSLSKVISLIEEPTDINKNVFQYTENYRDYFTSAATLYVPIGTKEKYEATEGWKEFKTIVEGEPVEETPGDLNGDGKVNVGDIMAIINIMADGAKDLKGDVNGDGAVNVGDIMAIINIMAGQ